MLWSNRRFGAQPVRVLIVDDSRSSLAFISHVIGALEDVEIAASLITGQTLLIDGGWTSR